MWCKLSPVLAACCVDNPSISSLLESKWLVFVRLRKWWNFWSVMCPYLVRTAVQCARRSRRRDRHRIVGKTPSVSLPLPRLTRARAAELPTDTDDKSRALQTLYLHIPLSSWNLSRRGYRFDRRLRRKLLTRFRFLFYGQSSEIYSLKFAHLPTLKKALFGIMNEAI